MSHYRDPLAGLRSQVAIKRALVQERERDVSPVLRALLPREHRERIDELTQTLATLQNDESLEELSTMDGTLDGLVAAYDEAIVRLPELRETAEDFPDPARPRVDPPWLIEEDALQVLRGGIEARVRKLDPNAKIARFGDFAYVARFHVDGAPFTFVIVLSSTPDDENLTRYESYLRTSVPDALAPLVVRRQGAHLSLGKALHIVREVEIGDEAFDDGFWITGARATTALLTASVRRALESSADLGPVLRIADGLATTTWSGYWRRAREEPLPEGILRALAGIRTAIARG